ncbi:MAG: EamA family transporter [Candidatus Cloacimonetes bacterium]|nr:EamA family transporter [Candidatus Cloacimonadota bacterium]
MFFLWIVSFIWAFSFGLIKGNLTGLDSNFVSFIRVSISFLIFLPFFRFQNLNLKISVQFFVIGTIQYGLMYISYIYSFQFLQAYQVALFTILTPIYVTIINDLMNKKMNPFYLISAIIAILGAAVIVFKKSNYENILLGFLIIQVSNISFAVGQVIYKKLMNKRTELSDKNIFALLYFGAVFITFIFSLFTTDFTSISVTGKQIYTLLYLGVISSGICFFLWNFGAKKVKIGSLAVMNNLKIPLAVACSLIFFGEDANIIRLFIGGGIILLALFFKPQKFSRLIRKVKGTS